MAVEFREGDVDLDFDNIVKLIEDWYYDSDLYKNTEMPLMPSKAAFKQLDRQNILVSVVGYEDGELVAAYVGVLAPHMFNPFYNHCFDILWHVRRDKRKGTTTHRLLQAFEELMEDNQVNYYGLSFSANESYDGVAKALEKRGFKNQDRFYLKFDRRFK